MKSSLKTPTSYYLFKSGALVGPINAEKLETLRASGELKHYAWIIDEASQRWEPITTAPHENPFLKTKENLKSRELSGVFTFMKKPYLGIVQGIHSFGLEILMKGIHLRALALQPSTQVQLNLADETNENALNTKVVFQSAEEHEEGLLIRFGWLTAPANI